MLSLSRAEQRSHRQTGAKPIVYRAFPFSSGPKASYASYSLLFFFHLWEQEEDLE